MKILHIFNNPDHHFCTTIVDLFRNNNAFNNNEHYFLIRYQSVFNLFADKTNIIFDLENGSLVKKYSRKFDYFILHSFIDYKEPLSIPKSIRKRVLWRTWGDDFYVFSQGNKKIDNLKRKIIRKRLSKAVRGLYGVGIANYIDEIDIKKHFGEDIKTFIFPYGLSSHKMPTLVKNKENNIVNVMIGHSGFSNDMHKYVLNLFKNYKDKFNFYIPLVYGKKDYMRKLIDFIDNNFSKSVYVIKDRLPFNDYCKLLSSMDFLILPYERSYGLGNLHIALNYSVNLVLSENSSAFKVLEQEGVPLVKFEELTDQNIFNKLVYKEYKFNQKVLKYYDENEKINFLLKIFNSFKEKLNEN